VTAEPPQGDEDQRAEENDGKEDECDDEEEYQVSQS
jgi:hypothetical protein